VASPSSSSSYSSPGTEASGANDAAGTSHLQVDRPSLGSKNADDGPRDSGSSAIGHSKTDEFIFIHGTRV
jgi:hypothetical protein